MIDEDNLMMGYARVQALGSRTLVTNTPEDASQGLESSGQSPMLSCLLYKFGHLHATESENF